MSNALNMGDVKAVPDIDEADLAYFCKAIEERAGIALKSSKYELIRTRLRSQLNAHGLNCYKEYREFLEGLSKNDPEWEVFTNLLTTNKTDFFREASHFEFLVQNILPEWLKSGAKTFKVWSAAASTGEEAYTLAMVLNRYLPKTHDFKIIATDIDTQVLATASNAVYSVIKKSEIPLDYQAAAIDFGVGSAKGWFRIKPHLKEKVSFRTHNLVDRKAPGEEIFDLVLCRNVLIYFSPPTIDVVQRKLFTTVKTGGHLFIGHSESLQGLSHRWKPIGPSIFKKDK